MKIKSISGFKLKALTELKRLQNIFNYFRIACYNNGMKKFLSSLLIFGQITFFATSAAQAGFNQDLTVHFRQPVSKQFVQLLSKTFKAPVTQLDTDSWRFKVPDLSTTDAYAELFASLPSVAETEPMPVSNSNDLIEPQVNVVLSRTLPDYQGASASPAEPSAHLDRPHQ